MRRIGIRELRQHASRYLRDVSQGEVLEITDRGRPVARLVPSASESRLEELEASGRLRPGQGDPLALGAPLSPAADQPLPSQVLAARRADER